MDSNVDVHFLFWRKKDTKQLNKKMVKYCILNHFCIFFRFHPCICSTTLQQIVKAFVVSFIVASIFIAFSFSAIIMFAQAIHMPMVCDNQFRPFELFALDC